MELRARQGAWQQDLRSRKVREGSMTTIPKEEGVLELTKGLQKPMNERSIAHRRAVSQGNCKKLKNF